MEVIHYRGVLRCDTMKHGARCAMMTSTKVQGMPFASIWDSCTSADLKKNKDQAGLKHLFSKHRARVICANQIINQLTVNRQDYNDWQYDIHKSTDRYVRIIMYTPLTKKLLPLENLILNAVLRRNYKSYFICIICSRRIFPSGKVRPIQMLSFLRKYFVNRYFVGETPPPNNRPYFSGKGVVKVVQIWHRDVQPGIVQSSNQIISRDRHDSNDLPAHKLTNLFYYIKIRGLGWPLNGGHVMLLQPCDSSMRLVRAESCWNTNGWFLFPNMSSTESRSFSGNVLT